MSAETTVTVTRTDDGRYTAVDAETGAFGHGKSKADALSDLIEFLRAIEEASSQLDSTFQTIKEAHSEFHAETDTTQVEQYEHLSARIQQRVRDEEIDEDVVEDAIEWARSQ